MTVKEMVNKMNTYNEIADMVNGEHLDLGFRMRFSNIDALGIQEDFKAFKKYLNKELIKSVVDAILNGDFTIGEDKDITVTDSMGDEITETVTFYVV